MSHDFEQDDFYLKFGTKYVQYPRIIGNGVEVVFDPDDHAMIQVYTKKRTEARDVCLARAIGFIRETGFPIEILGFCGFTLDGYRRNMKDQRQCIRWYVDIKDKIPEEMFVGRKTFTKKPPVGHILTLPMVAKGGLLERIKKHSEMMKRIHRM